MARIRTIKPEFPHSESMGKVSRDARLLFVELWTLCDDSGRARASSRMLASLLFPYDNDAPSLIDGWLAELEAQACIVRYQGEDGSHYLAVCKWGSHQKIDRPSASKIPPPTRKIAKPRDDSCEDRRIGGSEDLSERVSEGACARVAEPEPGSADLREWLLDRGVLRLAPRKLDELVGKLTADAWTIADLEAAAASVGGKAEQQRAARLAALLRDDTRRTAFGDDLARRTNNGRT